MTASNSSPGRAVLNDLFNERGMSIVHVAQVLGLRVPQVREARRSGEMTEGARVRLADLAGMLDGLDVALGFTDQVGASAFLETPLPLPSGYLIRPLDLYLAGDRDAVLALAGGDEPIEAVLDEFRPGWRADRSDFEVFEDIDGHRSIRLRLDLT